MLKPLLGITKKELSGHFHSLTAYVFIVVFLVSLTFLFFDQFFLVGQTSMRIFFALLPWFFLFLIPALSMRVWAEEKRQGTLESLLTLPIPDWQIVLAKFAGNFLFLGIVLLFSLSLPITLARIGDLDLGPVIGSYVSAWLLGGSYLALGQYLSSLTKNQIVAFLLSIASNFAFLIIGFPFVLQKLGGLSSSLLYTLSTFTHFENMAKGVIDFRDAIYYLSFIGLFLYLNYVAIVRISKIHSWFRVLVITGIVVVTNIGISPLSFKFDLTQEKRFTMARVTKEVLRELENPVTIKAFISKKIPETLLGTRQDLKDVLSEYDRFGGKNVIVEYLDPKTDQKASKEAESVGIQEIQFNTFGRETFEISSGFFGLAVFFEEKKEIFPVVQNTSNLELEITSAIQKMTRKKTPALGFISGHGEENDPAVERELSKQYDIRTIATQQGELIQPDIDILMLVGPKENFTEREQFILDQFVMSGKPLLVFADGMQIDEQFFTARPTETNINDLIQAYGISFNNDIAVDLLSQEALQFSSGIFVILKPYPAWPKIVGKGISQNHPITSGLRSLSLPWPSTISISDKGPTKNTITTLLTTSPESYTLSGDSVTLHPEALEQNIPQNRQVYAAAALVSGPLQSAFSGKKIPVKEQKGNVNELVLTQTQKASVLVFGSSRMLESRVINASPENFAFLANALDTLSAGRSFSEIRARNGSQRPIQNLSPQKQQTIKYGNIFASVVLSLLFGLGAYAWRKKKDKRAEITYGNL